MITHDEKAYLHCRINLIMTLLSEIVHEMAKWPTDTSADDESAGAR